MINVENLKERINEYIESEYGAYVKKLESEIDRQLVVNSGCAHIEKFKFIELMQDVANDYSAKTYNAMNDGFMLVAADFDIVWYGALYYSENGFKQFLDAKDENMYSRILRYIMSKYCNVGYITNMYKKYNSNKYKYTVKIKYNVNK